MRLVALEPVTLGFLTEQTHLLLRSELECRATNSAIHAFNTLCGV